MRKFIQLVIESRVPPTADRGVLLARRLDAKVRVWGLKDKLRLYLLG